MSSPTGRDISDFSRYVFREIALGANPPVVINANLEFQRFLTQQGVAGIDCSEYVERNRANVLAQLQTLSMEWRLLGVKAPLAILPSSVITWKHSKFRELSDLEPIPDHFPALLRDLRSSGSSRLLGYIACYLYCLGCSKVFITDQSHDGGIDLIGSFGSGPLSHLGFFVQAKAAEGTSTKREVLLAEYAKFLLLRKIDRWKEYLRALGLNESLSGVGPVYLFATNAEFKPGLRDAARDLEAGIRTGRQIAAVIAENMNLKQLDLAMAALSPFKASLSMNLAEQIKKAIYT